MAIKLVLQPEPNDLTILEIVLKFISDNQLGDIASIIGTLIAVGTLFAALSAASKSKQAATEAEIAVQKVQEGLKKFNTATDLATIISALDEIKRLHIAGELIILRERYQDIRKTLTSIRHSHPELSDEEQKIFQASLTHFNGFEEFITTFIVNPTQLGEDTYKKNVPRLNRLINHQTTKFQEILIKLQQNVDE